jgi:S1-C subfamily serine protease
MAHKILAAIAVFFIVCCSPTSRPIVHTPDHGSHEELAARILRSTVKINVGRGHGTGFFCFKSNVVCTAAHVVDDLDGKKLEVIQHNGKKCSAVKVITAIGHDVAALEVTCNGTPLSTIAKPREGMMVMVAGHPLSSDWMVTFGFISSTHENMFGGPAIGFDAAVNPGNSGGPIVDMHGHLVGVVNAIRTRDGLFAGMSFGTDAKYLLDLVF